MASAARTVKALVLGNPGEGKSTLLNFLANQKGYNNNWDGHFKVLAGSGNDGTTRISKTTFNCPDGNGGYVKLQLTDVPGFGGMFSVREMMDMIDRQECDIIFYITSAGRPNVSDTMFSVAIKEMFGRGSRSFNPNNTVFFVSKTDQEESSEPDPHKVALTKIQTLMKKVPYGTFTQSNVYGWGKYKFQASRRAPATYEWSWDEAGQRLKMFNIIRRATPAARTPPMKAAAPKDLKESITIVRKMKVFCNEEESEQLDKITGCFAADTMLQLETGGVVPIADIAQGDRIRVGDGFEPVLLKYCYDVPNGSLKRIMLAGFSKALRLTKNHYCLVEHGETKKMKLAKDVVAGDSMFVWNDGKMESARVVCVDEETDTFKLYNVQTQSNTVIADGILASTLTTHSWPNLEDPSESNILPLWMSGLSWAGALHPKLPQTIMDVGNWGTAYRYQI